MQENKRRIRAGGGQKVHLTIGQLDVRTRDFSSLWCHDDPPPDVCPVRMLPHFRARTIQRRKKPLLGTPAEGYSKAATNMVKTAAS